MTVTKISGEKFHEVEFGTAPGTGTGYIIGMEPIAEFLRVDENEHAARLIGVKYSRHEAGDQRHEDSPPDEDVRITMLVEGEPWRQRVWHDGSHQSIELILNDPGAFIAWKPSVWHFWSSQGNSTMFTVSFRPCSKKEGNIL